MLEFFNVPHCVYLPLIVVSFCNWQCWVKVIAMSCFVLECFGLNRFFNRFTCAWRIAAFDRLHARQKYPAIYCSFVQTFGRARLNTSIARCARWPIMSRDQSCGTSSGCGLKPLCTISILIKGCIEQNGMQCHGISQNLDLTYFISRCEYKNAIPYFFHDETGKNAYHIVIRYPILIRWELLFQEEVCWK